MIQFDSIWKRYTRDLFCSVAPALQDISFSLKKGQTLGLIGANGAGKSTSIRLIMDFIRPDQGGVQIFNSPPRSPQLRQNIGYLPETASFPANLTVLDLLRFTGATCGIHRKIVVQRSQELLTLLGLWEVRHRPLRAYSKGMQQRANFAIALINDPELLILDEPMSGLDPIGRAMISDLIQQLKAAGKTILFCSHILEDVDRLVDNILVLHKGKKLFYGTPAEFAAQENKATMTEAFISKIQKEEGHV